MLEMAYLRHVQMSRYHMQQFTTVSTSTAQTETTNDAKHAIHDDTHQV